MGTSMSYEDRHKTVWDQSKTQIIDNIAEASRLFFENHCTHAPDAYISYNALFQAYAAYLRHVVPHDQLETFQFMEDPRKYFEVSIRKCYGGKIHDQTIVGIGMPKWILLNDVDKNILAKREVLPDAG